MHTLGKPWKYRLALGLAVGVFGWLGGQHWLAAQRARTASPSPDTTLAPTGITSYPSGLPYVRFYSPADYNADQENYAATQDWLGRMCFANDRGLLVFDGEAWEVYPLPSRRKVHNLWADSAKKRIYLVGYQTVGYFEPNAAGHLAFTSILEETPDTIGVYQEFDGIVATDSHRFFVSARFILQYDKDGKYIRTFESQRGFGFGFGAAGRFYVREDGVGLLMLEGDSLRFVPGSAPVANYRLSALIEWDGSGLLLASNELQVLTNGSLAKFHTEIDDALAESNVSSLTRLPTGNIAVATEDGDVWVLDHAGKLKLRLNAANGVARIGDITNLFSDREGFLWATSEFGIYHIQYPSLVTHLSEAFGLEGTMRGMLLAGGNVYVATSRGLFVRPWAQGQARFAKIPQIAKVEDMAATAEGSVFVADVNYLYEVRGNQPQVLHEEYVQSIFVSKHNPRLFALGRISGGLEIFTINPDEIESTGISDMSGAPVNRVIEESSGIIWAQTAGQGIAMVDVRQGGTRRFPAKRFGAREGIPEAEVLGLFYFDNLVLASTTRGILEFEPGSNRFVPSERFGPDFDADSGLKQLVALAQLPGTDETYLGIREPLSGGRYRFAVLRLKRENGLLSTEVVPTPWLRSLDFLAVPAAGQVWIGTLNHIVVVDDNQDLPPARQAQAFFRRITVPRANWKLEGTVQNQAEAEAPVFPYSKNEIVFEYAVPAYGSGRVLYTHQLEGPDGAAWSVPSFEATHRVSNLAEGAYAFTVKAIDATGNESLPAVFSFEVLPPWYRTWYAFAGGAICLVFMVYASSAIVSSIRRKRYEAERLRIAAENQRLEREVEARTSDLLHANEELKSQKELLDSQKTRLEKANNSLEQSYKNLNEANTKLQQQQAQLVSSEKLAILGKLTPSVAHEINTPLGAILGSLENLQSALPQSWLELSAALQRLPQAHQISFWAMAEMLRNGTRTLGSREERRFEDQLEHELQNQGVVDPSRAAKAFVKIGLVEHLEELLPPLQDPAFQGIFIEQVYAVGMIWKQLMNIRMSSERAITVLKALRQYTKQRPDAERAVPIDVGENIDLVLTVYNYYIAKNLVLQRDYREVPHVMAFPEQLMQVWTNLLNNAAEAMQGHRPDSKGALIIRVFENHDDVVVEFENDGPMIPEHVLPNIFTWQFTTKDATGGSGLGLAITKDIVALHKGQIYVDSTPQRTLFTVRLPKNA